MSNVRPGLYRNSLSAELQVVGFIGRRVGVDVGIDQLGGGISYAATPAEDSKGQREYFRSEYVVTKDGLRQCGYTLITPDPDTEAYGDLNDLDGKLTASDEAVDVAAKAMASYAVTLDPEEDPDQFMTWDEMDEEDREKMRGAARATIDAALPLLKYAVPE